MIFYFSNDSHPLAASPPERRTGGWSPGPPSPPARRPAGCRGPPAARTPSAGRSENVSEPRRRRRRPDTGTERRPPTGPERSAGSSLLIKYDTFTIIGRALLRLWKLYKIMDNPRLDFNKMRKFYNKRQDKRQETSLSWHKFYSWLNFLFLCEITEE